MYYPREPKIFCPNYFSRIISRAKTLMYGYLKVVLKPQKYLKMKQFSKSSIQYKCLFQTYVGVGRQPTAARFEPKSGSPSAWHVDFHLPGDAIHHRHCVPKSANHAPQNRPKPICKGTINFCIVH